MTDTCPTPLIFTPTGLFVIQMPVVWLCTRTQGHAHTHARTHTQRWSHFDFAEESEGVE
jgi:hypothetical protein